jgi:hypothetical protein
LTIVPDARNFRRDLEAELRSQQSEYKLQVGAETARAREDLDRMRAEQEARAVKLRVDVDQTGVDSSSQAITNARRKVEDQNARLEASEARLAAARERTGRYAPEIAKQEEALARARSINATAAAEQAESRLAGLRAKAADDGARIAAAEAALSRSRSVAQRASEDLSRALENERGTYIGLAPAVQALDREFSSMGAALAKLVMPSPFMAGLALLPAAAVGVVELAGAFEQLADAVLVLPGILGGVGADLGTLLVGVDGVADAYKALGKEATDSGEDQKTHAQESRQANDELSSAVREQGSAERERASALRDSRQELEDLNLQLRGGKIDTAQAVLDAQKAREDLATGHYKTATDYEQAQLRVVEADQHVAESLQHNNELQTKAADENLKGINNSDKVVAANDRVDQANQRVTAAQQHLDDVNNKVSASGRAAAEAMSKLAPNAQEFVKTIFDLAHSGDLKALQTDTQQNLFAGMSASVKGLVASDLPALRGGFEEVASALNVDFKQLFTSLGSGSSQSILSRVFGDTAQAQNILRNGIDPLVHAMGVLTGAGANTLPAMADAFDRITDRFDAFITAADQDGRLQDWIDKGEQGFGHLGDIIGNTGQIVHDLTTALGGQGLLSIIDTATGHLATFLKSSQGQQELREFFQKGEEDLRKWLPILDQLPGIIGTLIDVGREWMNAILPPLELITSQLSAHPQLITDIVVAFGAWKTLTGVADLLINLKKISELLRITLPADAAAGAAGTSAALAGALGPLAAIVAAIMIAKPYLEDFADKHLPHPQGAPHGFTGFDLLDLLPHDNPGPPAPPSISSNAATAPAGTLPGPAAPNTASPSDLGGLLGAPSYDLGGATRDSGGGYPAIMHPKEYVANATGRATLGDDFLGAANKGVINTSLLPHFDQGGPGDALHLGTGAAPGPSSALGPLGGLPAMPSIDFGKQLTQGLSSMLPFGLGTFMNRPTNPDGSTAPLMGTADDGRTTIGGHAIGLDPKILAGDPTAVQGATDYLKTWGTKTLTSGAQTLMQGGLGFFGMENSILSPSNKYNQDIGQVVGNFGGSGLSGAGAGTQSITLGDGSTIQIPTYGSSSSVPIPSLGGSTVGAATGGPDWNAIAQGESGGNWADNTGNGYFGGLQFKQSTWDQFKSPGDPARADLATKDQQIAVAQKVYAAQGPGAWPNTFKSTASAAATGPGGAPALSFTPGQWTALDALASSQFGLAMTSGYRPPNGPTIAGVTAAASYHGQMPPNGRAHDYAGGQMVQFANFMADNYGPQLKELIHSAPGFTKTIKDGAVKGPFGAFYTLGQAGNHADHVHVAYDDGGIWPTGTTGINASGKNETVLNDTQAKSISAAMISHPNPPPQAHLKNLPPAPSSMVPAVKPAQLGRGQGQQPDQQANKSGAGPLPPGGVGTTSADHNAPGVSTAIKSGAAAIGNAAAMAASMGSMGMGGAAGGMIQGLATIGGKAVNDLVNVGSSFLVGNVTGSTTANASGETYHPTQQQPATASAGRATTYNISGNYELDAAMTATALKEAQDQQSHWANYRPS